MNLTKLDQLLEMTSNGVFALVNEQDRKVDVRLGTNVLRSVARLITDIKSNAVRPVALKQDLQKLKLVILENEVADLGLCHAKWRNYYKEQGYTLYRSRPGSSYSLVVLIDYVPEVHPNKLYFIVKLVGKSNSIITGVFDNNIELQDFTSKYYSKGVVEVVFASNNLTSYVRATDSSRTVALS